MKRVRLLVSNWLTRIAVDNSMDYFDINKEAEDVARRLLNQLLDSELENLNLTKKRNFPGIDLARESGFAVQVTSQKTAEKIRDSLVKFEKNELYKNYPKGVRFLILSTEVPNFKKETKESFTQCYRDFDPDEHIWSKSWLLNRIATICQSDRESDRDRFNVISDILEEEFGAGEKLKDGSSRAHLSHLPPISENYGFPRPPFRFLRRYRQEDARIFFGRSDYIHKLFESVTRHDSAAVTLLYGQSGVGKSSLLEAGLLPRIEGFSNVIYTRRNREKGLNGTLEDAINNFFTDIPVAPQNSLADIWKHIETKTEKPFIILIDQAEEVFTDPNSRQLHELNDFVKLIKILFSNRSSYPRGRLVIGYRKEFHANFEAIFDKEGITDYCKLFLEPLDKEAIVEVVTGLTRTHELRNRYNIRVEAWLPDIIANDLSVGKSTPIAPVLQFIMSRMWEMLLPDVSGFRTFTINEYRALREQGTAMKDFFRKQMEALESWDGEVVASGLVLDILKHHTTPMGTAFFWKIEELRKVYRNRIDILETLVSHLKNLYLLTDTCEREKTIEGEATVLIHDILAPVVIDEYNRSPRPGQRASIILAAKMGEFRRNREKIFLNEAELEILELGRKGMKALTPDEEELLRKSRERKVLNDKEKRRNRIFRNASIAVLIFVTIFAVIQWIAVEYNRDAVNARRLAVIAESHVKEDPTIALRIAETAWRLNKNQEVNETFYKIFRENVFYKIAAKHKYEVRSVAFSPDGRHILTGSIDGTACLWDMNGKIVRKFYGYGFVYSVAFSPDGKTILIGSRNGVAFLWNLQGEMVQVFKGHKSYVNSVTFSPDGKTILTGSYDNTARLWSLQGKMVQEFSGHTYSVSCVTFSPDGKTILTGSVDGTACLWNLQGQMVQLFNLYKRSIFSVAFSPDGKTILTGSEDSTIRLWDLRGNVVKEFEFDRANDYILSVVFSPNGKSILASSKESSTARLWDLYGNLVKEFKGHHSSIYSVAFSPDGKSILTGSWDGTARLWFIELPLEELLEKGNLEPLTAEQKEKYGIEGN